MSYLPLSEDDSGFSIEEVLKAQSTAIEELRKTSQEQLFWRKIATGAAVAGALFAMIRLTDIWLAVRSRRAST